MFKNTVPIDTSIFYLCFAALLFGFTLPVSGWWWLLAIATHVVVITIFSAVIHRYYCHDSYEANGNVMFWLSVITTTYFYSNPIQWRVLHSRHHAYSDEPNDPHLRGFNGFFGHGYATTNPESKFIKTSMKLIRDKRLVWINNNALLMGAGWGLFLLACGFNWFLFAFAIPIFTNHLCNRLHKQFAHGGMINADGTIGAKNRWWLEYIFPMGGEWIHEQHHVVSNEPYYKTKWYQIDTGGMLVKLLSR